MDLVPKNDEYVIALIRKARADASVSRDDIASESSIVINCRLVFLKSTSKTTISTVQRQAQAQKRIEENQVPSILFTLHTYQRCGL